MINFKRIMVGIDTTNESENVERQAIDIAKKFGAELHAITVFDIPGIYTSKINPGRLSHIFLKEVINKIENRLSKIKEKALQENLHIMTKMLDENSRTDAELLHYSKAHAIDLIIVGKGKGKGEEIKDLVLGSTSLEIAKHAECSVLLIKYRDLMFLFPFKKS